LTAAAPPVIVFGAVAAAAAVVVMADVTADANVLNNDGVVVLYGFTCLVVAGMEYCRGGVLAVMLLTVVDELDVSR